MTFRNISGGTATYSALVKATSVLTSLAPLILQAADFIVGSAIITVLFAMLFKILLDVKPLERNLAGAFVTAILFSVGRVLIALYLGHSTVPSVYGAAGSLVTLLVWVYYSCAILFFRPALVRAYCKANGIAVAPKSTAVEVRQEIAEHS